MTPDRPPGCIESRVPPWPGAAWQNPAPGKVDCPSRTDALAIVRRTVRNAVAMLDNTIGELTRAREAACGGGPAGWPRLGDVTACWLKFKLGVCIENPSAWTDPSSVNKSVAEVLRRLIRPRDLLAGGGIEYVCDANCVSEDGTDAIARVTGLGSGGKCFPGTPKLKIHLCPAFWDSRHAPYREQTIIHEAVHLTHCAAEGQEDKSPGASIGSPTCLAQFVAATNGKKLNPSEKLPCGFTPRCGSLPAEPRKACGIEFGPPSQKPDWKPVRSGELEFDPELDLQIPDRPAITVLDLAAGLADLVFAARNPAQRGRRPASGALAAAWRHVLNNEVWPALRSDSAERTICHAIFFARHPEVRGPIQQLPAKQRDGFRRELEAIRAGSVQPLLGRQITRGPVNSRTVFVADQDVFKTLPALTRNLAGEQIARLFHFVGAAQPAAPVRIIFLEPARFPESYNLSDATISVTGTLQSAYVDLGFHQQTKNINRRIRALGGRLTLDDSGRAEFIQDRSGTTVTRKFAGTIPGIGPAVVCQMISIVGYKDVIDYLNKEVLPNTAAPIPGDDPRRWTEEQQRLVGLALGRAMAHEIRHCYVSRHAAAGLGAAGAPLFGKTVPAFSAADQGVILSAIQQFEAQQGSKRVIPTYNNADDRAGDFPF